MSLRCRSERFVLCCFFFWLAAATSSWASSVVPPFMLGRNIREHKSFASTSLVLLGIDSRGGASEGDDTDADIEMGTDDDRNFSSDGQEEEAFESSADDDEDSVEDYDEYEEYDGYDKDENEELGDMRYDETSIMNENGLDTQYFMPTSMQLYASLGCMMLGRRIDYFNPFVVRVIRLAFIIQIIFQQVFVIYVRLAAKRRRDLSVVSVRNPALDLLASQMKFGGDSQNMVKELASSFLSSETTVMDYDMKQASDMQGGVVVNMLFMWFLHFKLEKVQPLLIQVIMGFLQLCYSPLFQVYVLGRNLERPFKNQRDLTQKKNDDITNEKPDGISETLVGAGLHDLSDKD